MMLITFLCLFCTCIERKPVHDAVHKLSHYRSRKLTRKMTNLSVSIVSLLQMLELCLVNRPRPFPSASLFIS